MYIDPDGTEYAEIPQRWLHQGKQIELAGDWHRAMRRGWTRTASAPPPFRVSKLKLVRALRAAGLEPAFDDALAADPRVAKDWLLCQEIHSDDPLLTSALPQLAQAAGMTAEQAWELLRSCSLD